MKYCIALIIMVFFSTAHARPLGEYDVTIEVVSLQPFSAEHRKVLNIDKNGKKIARQKLYGKPEAGLPLNVFKTATEFIFIDCNGYWYGLNRKSGKFVKKGQAWEKALPPNYLGTFRLRKGDKVDSFSQEEVVNLSTVYLYQSSNK